MASNDRGDVAGAETRAAARERYELLGLLGTSGMGAVYRVQPTRASTTIAVLPFACEGPEADRYLADALSGDLIDTLSMTRGLVVRPRSVVARVERGTPGFRELGRELAVDVIVEGTVRRMGERIRVSVRVIGTDDELQLFAHRVDTTLDQLLVTLDARVLALVEHVRGGRGRTARARARARPERCAHPRGHGTGADAHAVLRRRFDRIRDALRGSR